MKTKKLKQSDLQLHDLLYYQAPWSKTKKVIRVGHLAVCNDELPDWYKPIPLTRKRLEKNGFVFDEVELEWLKDWDPKTKEAYDISKVLNRHGFYLIKRANIYWITDHILLKPIRYVHEFQQVLRLFGKEDLANNFKIK